ncbi:extracellular solute-binding protein [Plantactinospora sp. S1510]|uniref:Extracellular solute-binding protein n=1 Tax=Plantactinospora alkalitolerans TaxID=2789879 RepID=A0ABS0H1K0_9ACTN|nr:extracellular solute-binding protein [Plantactinospora alkalitolerans]MBF9132341.1 extracellular solute-binding protein [Plantactinospora alkalitolerans]
MRAGKLLTMSVVLATGLLATAACGGDSGDEGSSGGKVTMSFWHNATTGPGKAFWDKTVADFEAANPNVKIEIQSIQNEDLDGKLQTALNSGDAPDVFMQRGGGKMAAMVKAGQLMDITGGITDATKKVVSEGSFKAQTIDNKVYAMPVAVLPGGFFYSKDLFAKAGITQPPATLADLQTAVGKLKADGSQPIALGAKDAWPAAFYYYFFALRECSTTTVTETAKSMSFDDPCWLKAGQDVQAFAATQPFNKGFLTTSAQQGAGSSAGLIANHKAAMELMGAWNPGVIGSLTPDKKPLPDLDWFPFPSIDGGAGEPGAILGGVDGYSCSAKAPKAECTAFLNFMLQTPVQEAYYQGFQAPPVNSEAQAAVTEPHLKSVLAAYNKAPFVSQWLDTVYGQKVGNALNIAVVNLLAGKGSPEDIVNAVKTAAKRS